VQKSSGRHEPKKSLHRAAGARSLAESGRALMSIFKCHAILPRAATTRVSSRTRDVHSRRNKRLGQTMDSKLPSCRSRLISPRGAKNAPARSPASGKEATSSTSRDFRRKGVSFQPRASSRELTAGCFRQSRRHPLRSRHTDPWTSDRTQLRVTNYGSFHAYDVPRNSPRCATRHVAARRSVRGWIFIRAVDKARP